MAGPLLYKPQPKWQVWAAFGGAVAIHLIAVGIAALKPEEPVVDLSQIPEAVAEVTFEQAAAEPTPPPEEVEPEPVETPPEPTEVPEFIEEKPTPPPKRPPTTAPVAPIARPKPPGGPTGATSMSSAKASAVFGPKPEYPYEARRSKLMGSGTCIMTVDTASGSVTGAEMAQSTGSPILDNAATAAFRRWRFKPNAVPPRVRVPVTFTMNGAQF